jgi:hypothetical protein
MEKESKTKKKTTTAAPKRQLTLLEAVETIVEKSRESHLSDKFMKQCHDEIEFIANSYGITARQAILFCITLECGPYHVRHNELPRFLDMSNVKSLSFGPDINEMVKMRMLRFCDRDKDNFSVAEPVLNALRENKAIIRPTFILEDCAALFDLLDMWFDWLNDSATSPHELSEDLLKLYKDNSRKIGFAKQMLDLKLNDDEMLMLTFFCHRLVNADDDRILPGQLDELFERRAAFKRSVSELTKGTHSLMRKGWLEHVCVDGTADTSMFTITEKTKRELLAEIEITEPTIKLSGLMEATAIKAKTLFYPNSMQQQINELNSFLDEKQFVEIQQRLADSGFRTGFACLFYGAPGTGKTETVYQLARATGRSIMFVDVPQIKSKWVGDSEKNIKALFDRYRALVNRSEVAPIMLFNEADAIFGVRKNNAENAVDKMENTIQNIILQEMENLNGILIATTNLASNLDGAFERRFLYKVKFENPDATVRSSIWKEMIPELDDKDADTLANAFELSGGQIENVARKNAINSILHGKGSDRLATLMDYCKAETLETSSTHRPMGFK